MSIDPWRDWLAIIDRDLKPDNVFECGAGASSSDSSFSDAGRIHYQKPATSWRREEQRCAT